MKKKRYFKYNKFILSTLSLFCVTALFSQDITLKINGYVYDNEGPIENAYVEFTNGSTFEICITNSKGHFESPQLQKGEYQIKITHISHIPIFKDMTILESMNFKMEINSHPLDEVTIEGDLKKAIRIKNGNLVLDPSYLGNIEMSSALQLLSKIPGVSITSSGISIDGLNSGFKIDGRNTGLPVSIITTYLKSIPANKIKEITIASSALAENNASNVGGVINIVLKKEDDDSHSLSLNSRLQLISKELEGSSSGYYSMQKGKTYMSLYLDYENEHIKRTSNYHTEYSDIGTSDKWRDDSSNGNYYFGVLNLDYKFNNNNIIHFNTSFDFENHKKYFNETQHYYRSTDFIDKSLDKTHSDDTGDLFRIYLDYKSNDTLKWRHEVGYGVVWGKFNNFSNNINTDESPANIPAEITIQNRHYGFQHQIHYDLIYSQNNLLFKIGTRADLGNLSPRSRYDSIINSLPVNNDLFSTKYHIKENIYAAYVSLQYKYKKIFLYAGVRAEMSDMSVNSIYDKVVWNYNKTHLFPYAKISGDFGILNTTLSFSSGIERPPYLFYTPNYRYVSKYCYSTGNPNLLPSRFYKIAFENFLFDFLKINLSYLYKKDSYDVITYTGKNDFEEVTTYMNYADENKFIANIYIPYLFYEDKISGYLGFYGQYSTLADCDERFRFRYKYYKGFVLSNSTDYNITGNFLIGYNLRYQSYSYLNQYVQKPSCSLDLYTSYTLKKFTFGIQVYDILNKSHLRGTGYYINNIMDFNINNHMQQFAVSIKYNIMKGKKMKEKEDKGANTERFQ